VLGAGVSGLSTAYELSKMYPGQVLVLEKDNITGGLCKTVFRNNSFYDLGSHRIHYQVPEKQLNFIRDVCGNEILKNTRGGKLRLKNAYISYPINLTQFIISLGFFETMFCGISMLKYRILSYFTSDEEKNSDYQKSLIYKAGKRAYKIFYEPYALKVWGCDPSIISTTVVKKRVSMTNPVKFIRDIFLHYFQKQNLNHYYYLNHGIGDFAKGLNNKLEKNNSKIITDINYFELINSENSHRILFSNTSNENYEAEFETLISTIPIDELIGKLNPGEDVLKIAGRINWRGLKLVYVHVNDEPLLEGETFYFPETDYIFGRVSVPKIFSDFMQTEKHLTGFVCEIPCSERDELWNMKTEDISLRCFHDLKKVKLLSENSEMITDKNFVIDLPKVYPMYTIGWQKNLNLIIEYLQEKHKYIYSSGKCGFFLHCNMDHAIEIGLQLAQNIIEGKNPAQWYRNIDGFHNLKLRD
jgi:protoporphyrinogen oxidase